ncbi:uncharacterized protein (TIGR00255 family) [Mongoliibacter ruber]|uniref:Uncharacterized protein (TIGR00255 family) n=2 Tax=Mongoliibacter ruber TaxID=1750599 RepID=A0A2T0WMK4_9BACT|nr:uncharacterized protein (TIGR00255 family) [Mongoliibacter ruber]
MTGYGSASYENDDLLISVEVKTLNSKFLDLTIRSPRQISDKELEIRNIVSKVLDRGKVNLSVEFLDKTGHDLPIQINEELFEAYILKYQNLALKVGTEVNDLFKIALQSANVVSNVVEKKSDTGNWDLIKKVIEEALENCNDFRQDEGNTLMKKFTENIGVIRTGLEEIIQLDPIRKNRIRDRISNNFKDWVEENEFDKNRFEQELIYYFEKIDITEEIVRLGTHLDYFQKNLEEGSAQGKKLGFISQEIGREINTIGSKANDANMQQHVVAMKDELEKIKEQSLNIL